MLGGLTLALTTPTPHQATNTELVLCLDVDFLPSAGLHAFIAGCHASLRRLCLEQRKLLVFPAFESCKTDCDAATLAAGGKRALVAAVASGAARVFASDGRCDSDFPQGHRATDTSRWLHSDAAYSVLHEEGYEPFVISARRLMPRYDERFRGFGRNKIIQVWEAARVRGFCFEVLPDHFVVHARHGPSRAQLAVLGERIGEDGKRGGRGGGEGSEGFEGWRVEGTLGKPGERDIEKGGEGKGYSGVAGERKSVAAAERLLPTVKVLYDQARLELLRSAAGQVDGAGRAAGGGREGRLGKAAGQASKGYAEPMGRWADGRAPAAGANAAELSAAYELHFEYALPQLEIVRAPPGGILWRRSVPRQKQNNVALVPSPTIDRAIRLEARSGGPSKGEDVYPVTCATMDRTGSLWRHGPPGSILWQRGPPSGILRQRGPPGGILRQRGPPGGIGLWQRSGLPRQQQNDDTLVTRHTIDSRSATTDKTSSLWRRSLLPRRESDVTLVTCATMDRLSRLEAQCRAWSGVVSAAVLLPAHGQGRAKRNLAALHRRVEAERRCRLDITLLRDREQPRAGIHSLFLHP